MTATRHYPDVLLSIKPCYVEAIFSGTKRVEFRKKVLNGLFMGELLIDPVDVYLYASVPVKRIVGVCNLTPLMCDYADSLFLKYGAVGGISRQALAKYAGANKVWACEIGDAEAFVQSCDPCSVFRGFVPPQNMRYCTEKEKQTLRRYCSNYDTDTEETEQYE